MIESNRTVNQVPEVDAIESGSLSDPGSASPTNAEFDGIDLTQEELISEVLGLLPDEPAEPVNLDRPDDATATEVRSLYAKIDGLVQASAKNDRTVAELVLRDELATRIHDRLTRYEENAWERRYLDPFTRSVASIHRRTLERLAVVKSRLRLIPPELQKHSTEFWTHEVLDGLRAELETVLSEFGIELIVVDGNRFDRSCQEAVQRLPTSDASHVGCIAQRLAPGFRAGDRVIVPERVAVYTRKSGVSS
ncbi:MAG: nucleotide exchange factor GrpE [Planctomycetes bacterium]|nr:nucleotide exchange factor GrpE [Planctomycetota bacterium]